MGRQTLKHQWTLRGTCEIQKYLGVAFNMDMKMVHLVMTETEMETVGQVFSPLMPTVGGYDAELKNNARSIIDITIRHTGMKENNRIKTLQKHNE